MVKTNLELYETEQGEGVTITGKVERSNADANLSFGVEADCTIEIKEGETIVLTLVGTTDFTLSSPSLVWTPTDAHLAALTKEIEYECFAHIRNNSTSKERVLKFTLKILNS